MSVAAADHELARRLATEAGELLVELRAKLVAEDAAPHILRAAGDRWAHKQIAGSLRREAPGDAVLSEEGADDDARLGAARTWIVDPLDGTREFSQPPRTDWAVHVALVMEGEPVAAAVALPAHELTLATDDPPTPPDDGRVRPRLVVSRTRPPPAAQRLAHALQGELVPMGSAGAKAMAVVLGEAEIYAHSGGQYEWDSAAPVGVAKAAGLHASRLDGSPLVYNEPDPWLPDLLICRPELAEPALEALGSAWS